MKKYVLENVTKLTDEKYLNFYKLHYKSENEKQNYYDYVISSRRDIKNISADNPNAIICDAVMIVPYYYNKYKKEYELVLNKEFRMGIGKYLYSFPSGLVEQNEELFDTVKREAKEECGIEIDNIQCLVPTNFCDEGVTDETLAVFTAEVKKFCSQQLEDIENISTLRLPISKCNEFLTKHKNEMNLRAYLIIKYMQLFLAIKD